MKCWIFTIIIVSMFIILVTIPQAPPQPYPQPFRRSLMIFANIDHVRTIARTRYPSRVIAAGKFVFDETKFAPPVINMVIPERYTSDPCKCIVDTAGLDIAENIRADLKRFVNDIQKLTTARVFADDPFPVKNTIRKYLRLWADKNAMMNADKINNQGKLDRLLVSIAVMFVYIRLLEDDDMWTGDPVVESWCVAIATESKSFLASRTNNIRAWLLLSEIMAARITSADDDTFDSIKSALYKMIDAIDDKGHIESEMKRKSRALVYHAYHADPLVTSAYIMRRMDSTCVSSDHMKKLAKLVEFILGKPTKVDGIAQDKVEGKLPWLYLFDEMNGRAFLPAPSWPEYDKYMREIQPSFDLISDSKSNLRIMFG